MARSSASWGQKLGPYGLSLLILVVFIGLWEGATRRPAFDASKFTEDELTMKEFNGDIVRDANDRYILNPDKISGMPGPGVVLSKAKQELGEAFTIKGTNDHGIGLLIYYSLKRYVIGFFAAGIVGIFLGVVIGLSKPVFQALNPFIQVLKPISPVAWMPLLLYTVKDPFWTTTLVVFMAALFPTMANTAFGVNNIRADYMRVSQLLEMSYLRRLFSVILPASAPAIFAGLRISFASALVAIVPAEMLLGELGMGYNIWIEWNNLDISAVIFAVGIIGAVGFALDYTFGRLASVFTYSEA